MHALNLQQALRYDVMRLFVLLDNRDTALALPVRVFFADLRVHVVLHIFHDHVRVGQGAVVDQLRALEHHHAVAAVLQFWCGGRAMMI